MPTLLIVFIIGLSLSVSACHMPGPIKKGHTLREKKIAVVADMGNSFRNNVVGTTVFNNEFSNSDVTDWKINTLTANYVLERLQGKALSGAVVETNFFPAIQDEASSVIDALPQSVLKKIKPMGFDHLILIRPSESYEAPFFKSGYGQYTRHFFNLSMTCIYALYVVEVYDVHSEKLMAWEWVSNHSRPCEPSPEETYDMKEKLEQYSDREKVFIRDRTKKHMINTLDRTIDKLELH